MKPLYDRREIGDTLQFYSKHPEFDFSERTDIIPSNDDATIDKYINWLERNNYNMPYKNFIRIMTACRESFKREGNEEALKIVNKLIGDKRLYKKLCFTTDGSYRNNKIYLYFTGPRSFELLLIDYCKEEGEKTDLRDMIKKYSVIFCQLPIDKETFNFVIPWYCSIGLPDEYWEFERDDMEGA